MSKRLVGDIKGGKYKTPTEITLGQQYNVGENIVILFNHFLFRHAHFIPIVVGVGKERRMLIGP